MRADARALAACGRALTAAHDGRGMWRPVQRCTQALVAAGTRPALAVQCASAMAAVAQAVRDVQIRAATGAT